MGRPKRAADGGLIYHILDRDNARLTIFEKDGDFEAFEGVLEQAIARYGTDVLAWCLMPNHWHLVVILHEDGELSRFVGWLTLTHTQRWHAHYCSTGNGHLYQGRFKSFSVQDKGYLLTVCRYIERDALRANLVANAQEWRWSSLWRWHQGNAEQKRMLATRPIRRSPNWLEFVNAPQSENELQALRRSVVRGCPLGDEDWSNRMVKSLELESTLRPRGRPKKRNGS
jgi:putative transposase